MGARYQNPSLGQSVAKSLATVNSVLFAWRSYLAWPNPDKRYVAVVIGIMAAGSLFAALALQLTPPPKTRQAESAKTK